MRYKPNPDRNREIVRKKDEENWSFRRIAKFFNMSVSSVFEAYNKTKQLSPVKSKSWVDRVFG